MMTHHQRGQPYTDTVQQSNMQLSKKIAELQSALSHSESQRLQLEQLLLALAHAIRNKPDITSAPVSAPRKPSAFHGSQEDAHSWFYKMQRYYDKAGIDQATRLETIAKYLSGEAAWWWRMVRNEVHTWEEFTAAFRRQYFDTNHGDTAVRFAADKGWLQRIQNGYQSDTYYDKPFRYLTKRDGVWYFDDRLAVPHDRALRADIISEFHKGVSDNHYDYLETLHMITKWFWWPHMAQAVKGVITHTCSDCYPSTASI